MKAKWVAITLGAMLLCSPAPGRAGESRDAGAAAWSENLAARGITSSASATGMWIGNVAGGLKQGGVYNTLGVFSAEADLEKVTGWWKGGSAGSEVYWIRGKSASWYYVGDALTVSNLDGFDSIRLYQAWLQQDLWESRASLRAGSLAADEDFTGTESAALFSNGAFGWCSGVGANIVNGGPIYFSPALGARVAFRPLERWTLQAGFYDGDSFDSPAGDPLVNQHGLHFSLGRRQGSFAIVETSHSWAGGAEGAATPGTLKAGLWRHSADFSDNWADVNGHSFTLSGLEPASHHGNHGWYGSFEQRLWGEGKSADQGVTAWLRLSGAPSDRSAVEWSSDAGFNWAGLLPGRDADVFGVGVATANVSRDIQRQTREDFALSGEEGIVPDFERVIETVYQYHVGDHWSVSPGLQYVQHPGLSREVPNAWVPSLRVTFE